MYKKLKPQRSLDCTETQVIPSTDVLRIPACQKSWGELSVQSLFWLSSLEVFRLSKCSGILTIKYRGCILVNS